MINDFVSGLASAFRTYPAEERRKFLRVDCRYAVYCLSGKKVSEAIVSNIGPLGLRLETPKRMSVGSKVALVFRGVPGGKLSRLPHKTLKDVESKLPGKVLWCQRAGDAYAAGFKFMVEEEALAKTWVKPILDKLGAGEGKLDEVRHHTRARARIKAEVKCESTNYTGLLTNVSLGGALFQSNKHLESGKSVRLLVRSHPKLPALQVSGDIINHTFDVVSNSGLHSIQFKNLDEAALRILKKYVAFFLKTQGSS